ncbi:hypothetical protein FRC11_006017 [Ceratobasidium sp. 423]|nr:hypothetical protein FRC11_006017 [Ceratobasidium sp. 423]
MYCFGGTLCLSFLFLLESLLPTRPFSFVARAPAPKYPDLYEASIKDLQNGLDKGEFTSVDLVKAYFARVDEVNLKGPQLHAVIETNPQALAQAAALDAERRRTGKRSPLHGIPLLLKDNIATLASEGMNTTTGSYALFKSIVPGDATVAAKLRNAGAILLGKANLSEWANIRGTFLRASGWSGRGGQATNPYYPGASTCGSSSGSGVATAIGLAAGSLGTETDGSIVCPSSYNNLVGIKPTVGLTSRAGVIPISSHQDSVGPMTRSVADAAAILSIIAGRDYKDNYTWTAPAKIPDYTQFLDVNSVKGKRFGVPRAVFTDNAITGNHPSINVEFNKSLDIIRSMGGIVIDPADLPSANDILKSPEMSVLKADLKIDLNRYLKGLKSIPTGSGTLKKIIEFNDVYKNLEQPEGYEGQTIFIAAEATSGYNSTYYDWLREDYELGRQRGIDGALQAHNLDALLLPTNGITPSPAALAGYPIVTVPLGFHPNDTVVRYYGPNTVFPAPGVPFGLSFFGTAYSEPSLIGFAYAYEQRTHTRLKRRAYEEAIPKTQLQDIPLLGCRWLIITLFLSLLPNAVTASSHSTAKYPDLYEASIAELQSGLDGCQFSSVDLVKAYLARIDEVNLKGVNLRAVIETNPQAIQQAALLDKERKRGKKRSPLHGIPILLKDNIATEGMNTTAGSYALLGSISSGDATVTAKLRKAGAIVLGKANLNIPDYTRFLDTNAIKGKRFGVPRGIFTNDEETGNNPVINAEFDKALDTIRSLGGIVVDPIDLPFASSLNTSQALQTFQALKNNSGIVMGTDFKVAINKYLASLKSVPTKVTSLAKLIAYNVAHKNLEQPTGYQGQEVFLYSELTSYDSAYYEALRTNLNLTRGGIDAVLKSNKLDALVLPSNGLIVIPVAIAGYPMITVPLGFHPDNTTVVSTGPKTVYPAPGAPFGLSFIGTAYTEPSLIGFAYAYEQRTHNRLKKRAYTKAIPTTQLKDVIN